MPLVCYREGSDEIIGANFTFVTHKDDHFVEHFSAGVSLCQMQLQYNSYDVHPKLLCFIEQKSNHERSAESCLDSI